jgi:alanyl-tRNA synthetase
MHSVRDLRRSFLEFFRDRGHRIVPSSPLLPKDDPTLLFTTAGMVQFKPMFAGTVDLEYTRAATVQKCLRTSDLENVGRTKRHLTFFEMLGNFSFGDYFKKEAIEFAWDYSTNVIGFPVKDLWVSIYEDDNEAFDLWRSHAGLPAEKIVRLGKKDNFWGPAGDSGACGPCSELYLDRGPDYGCGSPDCRPGCECERFLEFWNLVFNQFYQDVQGALTPLPRTGIDTGMGLERLATLVQKVDSVFDTDELRGLVTLVSQATGRAYEGGHVVPISVIVEHARALTFAMSDGIYPSNEGRGYVLRRILRRALRFTRQIGVSEPFLHTLVDPLVAAMAEFYPEIKDSAPNVKKVIESEERRFLETIENGLDRLDEIMKSLKSRGEKSLSGKDAFVLYDTFGFPLEMTTEIAQEQGLAVNTHDFEKEMEAQRERGKQSWKGSESGLEKTFEEAVKLTGDTKFTGYDEAESQGSVAALYNGTAMTQTLKSGERGFIVLEIGRAHV